jgi:hypothetical protein
MVAVIRGINDPLFIEVYDVATGQELLRLPGCEPGCGGPTFSPDSKLLATAHVDCTILTWDMALAAGQVLGTRRQVAHQELESWWADLAGRDARKAHTAIWSLAAVPDEAVPLLLERLRPAAPIDAERVRRLVADLDSDQFQVRQHASIELRSLGEQAEPALAVALQGKPSAEQKRRIEALLSGPRAELSAEPLRHLRAVEVLEHCESAEAQRVLKMLATGSGDSPLTRNAKGALERMAERTKAVAPRGREP